MEDAWRVECGTVEACRSYMCFPSRLVTNAEVVPGPPYCPSCGHGQMRGLRLRVRVGQLPPGLVDSPDVHGCVLCSEVVKGIAALGGPAPRRDRKSVV